MALTATADPSVRDDILGHLGIHECLQILQSSNRANLHYEVRARRGNGLAQIAEWIKSTHSGETGIIYAWKRDDCEKFAEELRSKYNLSAEHYHAGIEGSAKTQTQSNWLSGRTKIIVATVCRSPSVPPSPCSIFIQIAFGMGIDKPDGEYLYHEDPPGPHGCQCATSYIKLFHAPFTGKFSTASWFTFSSLLSGTIRKPDERAEMESQRTVSFVSPPTDESSIQSTY